MNVNGMHATTADTEPRTSVNESGLAGGVWVVKCHDCDWSQAGTYALFETVGLRLAHNLGTEHENQSVMERAR